MGRKKVQTRKPLHNSHSKAQVDWWKLDQIYQIDQRTKVILFGIILITFLVYLPSLRCDFTNWDDDDYVTENQSIRGLSSENIREIFSSTIQGNYHPLTILSLAINYHFGGLNPFIYHLTNLILHLLNTLLVFYFIFLISKGKTIAALIVAIIFGIHPMHVESVAWVTERKDVLYTLFFLLGLIAYIQYLQRGKRYLLFISFFLFVFSLLSKPAAVVFPLNLFCIDYFLKREKDSHNSHDSHIIVEKIPFLLISLIFGYLTIAWQTDASAVGGLAYFTLFERIRFASYGFFIYIVKFFWPFSLSSFHPYPTGKIPLLYNLSIPFTLSIIILTVISIRHSLRYISEFTSEFTSVMAFSMLFYLVNIMLVLQFFSVGDAIMAERYTYLPYLGLALLIGYRYQYILDYKKWRTTTMVIPALAVMAMSVITFQRTKVWMNSESLWTNVIERYPQESGAYNNRGHHYRQAGKIDLALADYHKAIALKPTNHLAYNNRGKIYFDRGQYELAMADFNRSIELNEKNPDPYSNRGAIYAKQGQYDLALKDLDRSLELDPSHQNSLRNRAYVYTMLNQHEQAVRDYSAFLKYSPYDDEIINARGVSYQHLRQHIQAIADFTQAIQLKPRVGLYYLNRSYSYYALGDKAAAKREALLAQGRGTQVDKQYFDALDR